MVVQRKETIVVPDRGSASPEKVGWKGDRIDCQEVFLIIFMSFLLRN